MEIRDRIRTTKELNPKIYAYITPDVISNQGWVKIGYTEQENADIRIKQQTTTAGIKYIKLWEEPAKFFDRDEYFKDHQLHDYLVRFKHRKRKDNLEFFYYNGNQEEALDDYNSFIHNDLSQSKEELSYILREEQQEAVDITKKYFENHENSEFLWNAKPRFGKTLTTYDLIKSMNFINVLIVTNRPAIANSWFDDYEKFIAWNTSYKFISTSESLKDRPAISYEQFNELLLTDEELKKDPKRIVFLSLQDLKGSRYFSNRPYDKHKWIKDTNWDILVIDEAHEGVDTFKTDAAFSKIKRKYTLHLSGTPFNAIAKGEFSEEQIYNWTYADEQEKKEEWNNELAHNPYASLPKLNLFSYQMSSMITDKVEDKADIDGENIDYAFDLNEFFKTDNGKFIYEKDVIKWLDTLSRNEKYPFSTKELRNELKHTFWILDRVDSVKALEKLLRNHPVFENYEIVIAAGDGKSLESEMDDVIGNESSLEKVKNAIANNEKTITLSVGQLTTGVTIPEWTGVLILSNIKSASLYMQAAFRSQNPWEYTENGKLIKKENAYIFDFAPERTLTLYYDFANNLNKATAQGRGTTEEHEENIRKLLNFFPVIAEDDQGKMVDLDAKQVMTIPKHIVSKEVVKRGFMSNLLFQNIAGIFSSEPELREILDNLPAYKDGKSVSKKDIDYKSVEVDEEGDAVVDEGIIINDFNTKFGSKFYEEISEKVVDSFEKNNEIDSIVNSFKQNLKPGLNEIAKENGVKISQSDRILKQKVEELKNELRKVEYDKDMSLNNLNLDYKKEIEKAETDEEKIEIEERRSQKLVEIKNAYKEEITKTIDENHEKITVDSIEEVHKVAENKIKTSEEDKTRDRLRGFARTIPSFLMAYGTKNTRLNNFDELIDDKVFKDVTSITLDQFRILRDKYNFFNEIVFDESVQEFLKKKEELSNYFDDSNDEDIFDYIPAQKTNQIYTPRKVVNMMLDALEKENPGIFTDSSKTFADLYVKSGLYLTEMVKRLYKGLEKEIPDSDMRVKHILENQVYGFAPTEIIYRIAKNFIFGFDERAKNIDDSHFVLLDTEPYAKGDMDMTLEEKLDELFGGGK